MPIKIGNYLFARLKQLEIKTVFGVPGDYELALLDLIGESGIDFQGNPNELIAGYAADGYSRLNGAGAFVTTFGPGELSAYCSHAGAYTEFVPVVHIVGYPGRLAMDNHTLMHHSLGTGEFMMYHEMVKHISVDTTVLLDPQDAPTEIDRCLRTMMQQSRPVYIGVPVDMSHLECDDSDLQAPLQYALEPNDTGLEKATVLRLCDSMATSNSPIIIVDGNAVRNNLQDECRVLSHLTGFPTFTTYMGKGCVDETLPNFGGLYAGAGTYDEVKKAVESADLVLWIGNVPTDFNTGEFTGRVSEYDTVEFQRSFLNFKGHRLDLRMAHFLTTLIDYLQQSPSPLTRASAPKVTWDPSPMNNPQREQHLTQDYLWPTLGKFFQPGDFIIGETGTSAFGLGCSKLPRDTSMFNQTIFGSIGYATGAAVGTFKAIQESGKYKRCILVTGEGSLHLTVQAFADMLKLDLKPIVFVLNNDGYTVERLIHGRNADYNRVPNWDYSKLAPAFGPDHPSEYYGPIDTPEGLDQLLEDKDFCAVKCFQLVELKLGRLDAPLPLRMNSAAVEAFNQRSAQGTRMDA